MAGVKRIWIVLLLGFSGACTSGASEHAPHAVAEALLEDAPADERSALIESIEQLKAAEDRGAIRDAQAEALSSLYGSAVADGRLTKDERALLTTIVHDLAAGTQGRPTSP